jgi:hypothetical protein
MSLSRQPVVLVPLLLLAAPRPLPFWSIQQQECAAMVLLLTALLWSGLRAAPREEPLLLRWRGGPGAADAALEAGE